MNWVRSIEIAILLIFAMTSGAVAQQDHVAILQVGDAQGLFIVNVPDESQPPDNKLQFASVDNWCAPLAAANALVFLDMDLSDNPTVEWATGVCGGLNPLLLSEYLGYFMTTNGEGSPDRENASQRLPGTLLQDIPDAISQLVSWHGNEWSEPPFLEPINKSVYEWDVMLAGKDAAFDFLLASIEAGIPPIICFSYWNPTVEGNERIEINKETGLIHFASWGVALDATDVLHKHDPKVPVEVWNEKQGIGHCVTGVGFIKGDPDGVDGPLAEQIWVIVHDNWETTPENIAIAWNHVTEVVVYAPRQ
jgi:hypothetical protein